jgi:nicotinamidase-related amidase
MDHIRGLRFGPPGRSALHLCIDMQRLFAEDSPWASAAVGEALPAIMEICRHKATKTVFTRFLCPTGSHGMRGQWRQFYIGRPEMLRLDPGLFELVDALHIFAGEGQIISRYVFSAFDDGSLQALLSEQSADTLIFSGIETDVCVLATALRAIDLGYRVIIVEDAVASSNPNGHQAALAGIFPRFDQQVELVTVNEILRAWETR